MGPLKREEHPPSNHQEPSKTCPQNSFFESIRPLPPPKSFNTIISGSTVHHTLPTMATLCANLNSTSKPLLNFYKVVQESNANAYAHAFSVSLNKQQP